MKTIKVTMNNGKPVIQTDGYSGNDCLLATERLEAELGNGNSSEIVRDINGGTVTESPVYA